MKLINNKKRLVYWVMTLTLIVTAGCSDLEETPDYINPDSFYVSANELKLGVNAIYDDLTMGSNDWFNLFYNRYVFECLIGYQVGWRNNHCNIIWVM